MRSTHGTSIDAVMYAWLFVHPVWLIVVTGTMNVKRIQTAVDAMNLSLSYDE
jgi:predicted oxidoreductase